ncbi:DMT family transporter [Mesorhizobium sp. LHD-90]|uniref:DMT family transporter n=1 Tax=Mesorhizobium sp. LHD-90 TaxID=3071414 RepID=UPI0027E11BE1|nr:DMT family transporter [Mesorhizobium sp. LHD-90]MDQ6434499.1 DMT family transporter [Mesorhizobium sp. LHD-90]
MSTHSTDHRKGLLLTFIGGLTLTADIPLIRLADGEAWSILLARCAATFIAGVIFWSVWRWLSPKAPPLLPGGLGVLVAALYGLGSITFIVAVYNTSTANLVFILAFTTMFSALLSWVFLKHRPANATLLAMAVMIIGVLIIVRDSIGSGNLFGDLVALGSAFIIASAITVSRHSGRNMGFTALIGVLFPLLVAAAMVAKTGYRIEAPWWIVLNGAIVWPISFYCLATGPRFLSAPEVAMFYLLETVLAPVWVWLIFSEAPSRNSLIGGTILIVALVAHSLWQLTHGRRRAAIRALQQPA